VGNLAQDMKYALRVLVRSPAFSVVALIVLALGIGANTAIFSVVDALLLRPLPLEEPDRLVNWWHVPPQDAFHGMPRFSLSAANYIDWKAQSQSYENAAIYGFSRLNLTGEGEPEAVEAARVESSFFPVMRARPLLGRTFTPDEDSESPTQVVILSEPLWRRRYGADPNIVGKAIEVDGGKRTVVGVMPAWMNYPQEVPIKVWTPLEWTDKDRVVRGNHNYLAVARLKPGVSIEQAQAELTTIAKRLEQQYPEDNKSWGGLVEPLGEATIGDARPSLLMMLGAVAFVLLIACANVANLVLARTLSRQKEIAIRSALGASRARVLQQTMLETVLLALAGGALGLLVAGYSTQLIVNFLGEDIARTANVKLDLWVLLFTLFVSLATGVLSGLLPAMKLTRTNVNDALKQGEGRTSTEGGGNRTRGVLVAVEMALSLMLLVGAGLTVRSLWNLRQVDPGLDAKNVLTFEVTIPGTRYPTLPDMMRFFDTVQARLQTLPGVVSAAHIDSLPVVQGGSSQPIAIEGQPAGPMAEQPEVAVRYAGPGLMKTLGIEVLQGRELTPADKPDAKKVIVISQSLAKRFWPGQDPIGKRLTLSFLPGNLWEVAGVVEDVKIDGLESPKTIPTLYVAPSQFLEAAIKIDPRFKDWGTAFVVRTNNNPESQTTAVASVVRGIDPQAPVTNVSTYESLLAKSLSRPRFNSLLLGLFAAFAMLLAAMGIYSVLSYAVRRRTREIGIRMALGAQIRDVLKMIVAEGMRPTLIGIAIGVVGALALGRLLSSIVFGVSATDPVTMVGVATLLVAVGITASVIPAWRATKVEPVKILREE